MHRQQGRAHGSLRAKSVSGDAPVLVHVIPREVPYDQSRDQRNPVFVELVGHPLVDVGVDRYAALAAGAEAPADGVIGIETHPATDVHDGVLVGFLWKRLHRHAVDNGCRGKEIIKETSDYNQLEKRQMLLL